MVDIEKLRREAVRAICAQQSDGPRPHVCTCMEEGGIGFKHFPAALLCRDTFEEIWDALNPVVKPLLDELERKTKALEAVREICRNDGRGSAIVNERIVERCEEVVIAALKGTPNDH